MKQYVCMTEDGELEIWEWIDDMGFWFVFEDSNNGGVLISVNGIKLHRREILGEL